MSTERSGIRVHHLRKSFHQGRVVACEDVNLDIPTGELLVLLGPSGCGKTTTLRCIAGLEQPDNADAIWIDGRNMTPVPPRDRDLAFVFQDTALFPHLNVRRNISFGLDMRRAFPQPEVRQRVERAARMLHVDHLLDRKPAQLSGGQGQRVALGRAIVMEPMAFLLDEPLAALDAALRVEMRTEIKQIQRRLNTTMLFVTHDQEEALSLGDKIAVMNDGRVQQFGAPREIYLHPANLFCASFIGSPAVNRFDCRLGRENGRAVLHHEHFRLAVPEHLAPALEPAGERLTLAVRPEFLTLNGPREDLRGRVALVELLGSRTLVFVDCAGTEVRVLTHADSGVREGDTVGLTVSGERSFYFGPDGDNLLPRGA